MPEPDVCLHLGPSQIKVAVFQPHLFIRDFFVIYLYWRGLCLGYDLKLVCENLDLSCRQMRILHALWPGPHFSPDADDKLPSEAFCNLMNIFIMNGIENNLSDAFTIPQVDKDDTSMIPPDINPAHEADFFSQILC